jgi:hypothetical protein
MNDFDDVSSGFGDADPDRIRHLPADRRLRRGMGGTTAKASLISDGEISVTAEYEVGGSGNAHRQRRRHAKGLGDIEDTPA